MENFLKIGVVVKPQGVRGEIKVMPLTDKISRFSRLEEVVIRGSVFRVASAKEAGGMAVLALSGINDRNAAETFRGEYVYVERKNAAPLEEGRYYTADIEGASLYTDLGSFVGTITEVVAAKTDIIVARLSDGGIIRFPFLKDLLVGVDVAAGKVTVKEKRLTEVALRED